MATRTKTPQAYRHRAEAYQRSRPTWPPEVIHTLEREIGFSTASVVADIGSGPGTLTTLLLDFGNEVFAVEPGEDMRRVAARLLGANPRFHSVAATAESTTLPDDCVDVVTAAQALTWFDPSQARDEFLRILRPRGHLVGLWFRPVGESAYSLESGNLERRWAAEYGGNVQPRHGRSDVLDVLIPNRSEERYSCQSRSTWEQCVDAYVSTSYSPLPATPEGSRNIEHLRAIFSRHQEDGSVAFDYEVTLCWGRP